MPHTEYLPGVQKQYEHALEEVALWRLAFLTAGKEDYAQLLSLTAVMERITLLFIELQEKKKQEIFNREFEITISDKDNLTEKRFTVSIGFYFYETKHHIVVVVESLDADETYYFYLRPEVKKELSTYPLKITRIKPQTVEESTFEQREVELEQTELKPYLLEILQKFTGILTAINNSLEEMDHHA